ncbi:MAG: hypothetical protein P4L62_01190 [Candidatus Pacebacteria bacterium]|nr:hypothetical protein [Candidatus Paceibacterota bacterium]MDR3582962.1 hypothetical protein [Candidatus Paceibacterota bacterium]
MRKIKLLVVLMVLSFLAVSPALAQTAAPNQPDDTGVVVMQTVSIANAKIVSQDKNNVKVSFDIYAGPQVQSDVRYGISLEPLDGSAVYEKAFPDNLTIGASKSVHEEITYQAPDFLVGDYQLYVVSKNSRGLLLSERLAGQVNFSGTGQWIELGDCYMTIQGEAAATHYDLNQGVDIKPSEVLKAHCSATSHLSSQATLQPSFEIMRRGSYGESVLVPQDALQPLTIAPNETKTLDFVLPKAMEPQAYDTILTYKNASGASVSNDIAFHYVIFGESATIQGVQLDKNSYAAGDTAQVSFFWTPSADIFSGSRFGGTPDKTAQIKISITDSNGQKCANDVEKALVDVSGLDKMTVSVAISSACASPNVAVSIVDSTGNQTLDALSFDMTRGKNPTTASPSPSAKTSGSDLKKAIALIVGLLFLISIIFIIIKRNNKARMMIFVCGLLGSAAMFLGVGSARADTLFSVDRRCTKVNGVNHCDGPTEYLVHIDGVNNDIIGYNANGWPEFTPNSKIDVYGETEYNTNCSNGRIQGSILDVTMNKGSQGTNSFNLYDTIYSSSGANAQGRVTLYNSTSQKVTLSYDFSTMITDGSGKSYYLYGERSAKVAPTLIIPAATTSRKGIIIPGKKVANVIATDSGPSYNISGPDNFTVSQALDDGWWGDDSQSGNYQPVSGVTAELANKAKISGGNYKDYAKGDSIVNAPSTPNMLTEWGHLFNYPYYVKFTGHLGSVGGTRNYTNSTDISYLVVVPGVCDSATNGKTLPSVPATNLCSAGTASPVVTSTSPWTWTCQGTVGTAPAKCFANQTASTSCTNSTPPDSHSLKCNNKAPLTNTSTNKLVSSCSGSDNNGYCEYYCNGYKYQNGKCVPKDPSCSPTTCPPANQICSGASCTEIDKYCHSTNIPGTKTCNWREVAP